MELPFKVIISVALVAFLLTTFYIFFSQQSGEQLSRTEANRIFYSTCDDYKKEKCDWSVRQRSDFTGFMDSCRVLFGDTAGDYSCLYQQCCVETKDILCSGLCNACRGNEFSRANKESCCARVKADCPDAQCDVC
ncbi:MAG: hypothetical protein HYW26_05990 [Candidatus Aenigmarchaeota archaeon]|nr:hypothetical protein [Candidatus Aenigmarchaeota archaeon]